MKTIIANPLYDAVFKFLMEDEAAAKALLSAMLKKKVVNLTPRNTEYNDVLANQVAIYRLDFSADVEYMKNPEDEELTHEKVLIEIQKAKATHEVFRFRRYVGNNYTEEYKIEENNYLGYHPSMVTIYILGHILQDLEEPVTYIRRGYYDYYDNPIISGVPHPFVESLTHDSIVAQIPRLKGKHRNKVERIMSLFEQKNLSANQHERTIEIPDDSSDYEEIDKIINRLQKAVADPDTRRKMDIEDDFVRELANKDNIIAKKDEKIEEQGKKLVEQKKQLSQKEKQLEEQEKQLAASIQLLKSLGLTDDEIAKKLKN